MHDCVQSRHYSTFVLRQKIIRNLGTYAAQQPPCFITTLETVSPILYTCYIIYLPIIQFLTLQIFQSPSKALYGREFHEGDENQIGDCRSKKMLLSWLVHACSILLLPSVTTAASCSNPPCELIDFVRPPLRRPLKKHCTNPPCEVVAFKPPPLRGHKRPGVNGEHKLHKINTVRTPEYPGVCTSSFRVQSAAYAYTLLPIYWIRRETIYLFSGLRRGTQDDQSPIDGVVGD